MMKKYKKYFCTYQSEINEYYEREVHPRARSAK